MLNRNCCFDYHYCERNFRHNALRQTNCMQKHNNKCTFCRYFKENDYFCTQCKKEFFLEDGSCLTSCSINKSENNKVCEAKKEIHIENCTTLSALYSEMCEKCGRGYFLFMNQCLKKCPPAFKADLISWTCVERNVAAVYYLVSSKGSCKDFCGTRMNAERDCSCFVDCVQEGTCCRDFEDFCTNDVEWK